MNVDTLGDFQAQDKGVGYLFCELPSLGAAVDLKVNLVGIRNDRAEALPSS